MIKRLIFDVDGTLITNIKFVEPATKTLKKLGIYSKVNLEKFLSAIKTYEKHYNRSHSVAIHDRESSKHQMLPSQLY